MKWKSFKTVQILQIVSIAVELGAVALMFCNIEGKNIVSTGYWIGMGVFLVGYLVWQYADGLEWEVIHE